MKISDSMRSEYPKLSKWIDVNLIMVLCKPLVFSAFKRYSELSDKDARNVLATDFGPVLHSMFFIENHDGEPGIKNGRSVYKSAGYPVDWIFLAKIICAKFENSENDARDNRMHILLESTILHEMVHWGDTLDGRRQRQHEEGKMFELHAYGHQINRYWRAT